MILLYKSINNYTNNTEIDKNITIELKIWNIHNIWNIYRLYLNY